MATSQPGCATLRTTPPHAEHPRILMTALRVHGFAVSLDGFSAGARQSLENPLGERGPELMEWFFRTRMFQKLYGGGQGETGVDNSIAERGFEGVGAWILGRNMFGPV